MDQMPIQNWWSLALCGVLDVVISAIYLLMYTTDGPVLAQTWTGTVMFLGELAMLAGGCTIAAAFWRSKNRKSPALFVNGLAVAALGFVQYGLTRFRISILVFAVLVGVMTVSMGIVALAFARKSRRQNPAEGWFFAIAGVISIGFVLPSIAFGLRWIPIEPGSHTDLLWLGSYFGFAAICTIALAIRLHRPGVPVSGQARA
jgi:uncharacterized membrane protein HdeD (DUF308 family)